MRYLIFTCLLAALYTVSVSMNTEIIIRGRVENESGTGLVGARVQVKNAKQSVETDADGSFSIAIRYLPQDLIFTANTYTAREVTVVRSGYLKVTLKQALQLHKMPLPAPDFDIKQEEAKKSALKKDRYQGTPHAIISMPSKMSTAVYQSQYQVDREINTEDYDAIDENRFHSVKNEPLSTFSIDVDAASYSNVRRYLTSGLMPPPGAVRIEEMINYFKYDYPRPADGEPFSVTSEMATAPWNKQHQLVRIGLQGKEIPVDNLPASNLVFLIDVSGSMMPENKLPLVQASLKLLVDNLRDQDRIAIVVYAGSAGLVLPSTSGRNKDLIRSAINRLEAGGSTAGGAGIELAYRVASENFFREGNNRVILCTDGDFNVGQSSDASLEEMISAKRKSNIFLTVLGYGMANYKDNKMQKLADKGNGNHAYIDGLSEAKKVLVHEFGGTLFTIAKDVKLQVEFNPLHVQSYRLIGYENRMLNKEDFNDDKKDAGELGSGHNVTALYEIIPAGTDDESAVSVDPLKYQAATRPPAPFTNEMLTVKLRYKQPNGDASKLITAKLLKTNRSIDEASQDLRFAAAVAEFGMLLGNSAFKQGCTYEDALKLADRARGVDREGYRTEFIRLIKLARTVSTQARNEIEID